MKIYTLEKDITTLCEKAKEFPHDVKAAFERLIAKTGGFEGRTMFGISYLENGKLAYIAACSAKEPGEAQKLGTDEWTIPKGDYLTELIENWQGKEHLFEATFKKLGDSEYPTAMPGIEWYYGEDVKCMLPLTD